MREHLGVEPAHLERLVTHTVFSLEGGAAAAGRLISRGATAVICGSDLMALGAIRQARSMGLTVPRDVSVVGYDDSTMMAFTDPPLTTIRQAVEAMGDAAVRALLDEIGGEGPAAGGVRLPARARRARLDRCGAAPRLSRRDGCRVAGIRGDVAYRLVGGDPCTRAVARAGTASRSRGGCRWRRGPCDTASGPLVWRVAGGTPMVGA